MTDARGSLRSSRDFRLLLVGQTTSQFGTQISGVAIPLLAVITLEASPLEVLVLAVRRHRDVEEFDPVAA